MIKKTIEVVAAVIEKDGKYFIAQRPDKGELALKWEFPGGKIEPGESHEEALIREINEEFNVIIFTKTFIQTITHEYDTFIIALHCYLCDLKNDNFKLTEHLNVMWVEIDQLESMDLAYADYLLIKYLKLYKKIEVKK